MGKHTKSASNILHNILVQHPIGYEFDVRQLQEEAIGYGYNFSEGALTGFIARALRKEIVSVKGTFKPKDQTRTRRKYTLVDKQDWLFKPAGVGSYPGREIHSKAHGDKQLMLLTEPEKEITKSSINKDAAKKMGIPVVDIPISNHSHNDMAGLPKLKGEIEYDQGSLSDQLINLAIKVNELENRRVKTLADYSTNDLIEELKTRIK